MRLEAHHKAEAALILSPPDSIKSLPAQIIKPLVIHQNDLVSVPMYSQHEYRHRPGGALFPQGAQSRGVAQIIEQLSLNAGVGVVLYNGARKQSGGPSFLRVTVFRLSEFDVVAVACLH